MSDIIMYIFNNFLLHCCNATNHKFNIKKPQLPTSILLVKLDFKKKDVKSGQ